MIRALVVKKRFPFIITLFLTFIVSQNAYSGQKKGYVLEMKEVREAEINAAESSGSVTGLSITAKKFPLKKKLIENKEVEVAVIKGTYKQEKWNLVCEANDEPSEVVLDKKGNFTLEIEVEEDETTKVEFLAVGPTGETQKQIFGVFTPEIKGKTSSIAQAQSKRAIKILEFLPPEVYLDGTSAIGYTSGTVPAGADSPFLLQYTSGFTAAYFVYNRAIATGFTTDFRIINQHSDVDTKVGNRRAFRFMFFAPTIIADIKQWVPEIRVLTKFDLQFLGNFSLRNTTTAGASRTFTGPFGIRFTALYPVTELSFLKYSFLERVLAGIHFETVTYSKESLSTTGEATLATKQTFTQFGLTAIFQF